MDFDFATAALSDRLEKTINYFDVAQELLSTARGAMEIAGKLTQTLLTSSWRGSGLKSVTVEKRNFQFPRRATSRWALARART